MLRSHYVFSKCFFFFISKDFKLLYQHPLEKTVHNNVNRKQTYLTKKNKFTSNLINLLDVLYLSTNLVTTLTSLHMNNFPHFVCNLFVVTENILQYRLLALRFSSMCILQTKNLIYQFILKSGLLYCYSSANQSSLKTIFVLLLGPRVFVEFVIIK